ncbi:PRD domain-containing protein [Oceanobacillus neutriphilus]|uniref:Transcription antitermination protein BlgG n=1 Tax=Oceanobacillus neutriphilus TaxID=531815 RepID=A0ABQ2NRW9_9BACI|nr:PRD domain-containing protein [Oceanobacillus neutriphilus]GGP09719.1 transcription antitermination protein BlgG [Oceanobacillus neutriphilus]
MKFLKAFNNNVVLVKDSSQIEWIVIGNGIGFQKHYGDIVKEDHIRKKFVSTEIDNQISLEEILHSITFEEHQMTMDIAQLAKKELDINFSSINYLTLADHLHHAMLRAKEENTLSTDQWEVSKLFPKEYLFSKKVIEFLKCNYDFHLPDSETSFLTFHFITVRNNWEVVSQTMEMTKLMSRIVEIIQYDFHEKMDNTSSTYSRFITHLRYFFLRYSTEERTEYPLNKDIIKLVSEKYPRAFNTCKKIANYLYEEMEWTLTDDELVYLTFHIIRLMDKGD